MGGKGPDGAARDATELSEALTERELAGIYPIVPTPFDDRGSVDEESIHRLTRFMVDRGVQGLAVLGVMGEAHALTDGERRQVVHAFREALPDRYGLVVGVGAAATDPTIHAAQSSADLGASALLVAPPPVKDDEVIATYFQRVTQAVPLPVVLHDYPASTGILLSVGLIARLHAELPTVRYIKLEDPPTGPKMQRLRRLAGDGLRVFGALGGMYAFEELDRGAIGIMTGFVYAEFRCRCTISTRRVTWTAPRRSSTISCRPSASRFQPKLGVALRKHLLHRLGAIASPMARHPSPALDETTIAHLDRILAYLAARGYRV